jgi:hypothetical protein
MTVTLPLVKGGVMSPAPMPDIVDTEVIAGLCGGATVPIIVLTPSWTSRS